MPSKPLRPCTSPTCRNLCKGGKCEKCKAKSGGEQRATPWRAREIKWRNSARWRGKGGLRQRHLRENPLCVECEKHGHVTAAKHVDHIVPARGRPEWFWRASNLQSLCHACHSRKTAQEG